MTLADAITSLRPGAVWSMSDGSDLSTLEWLDKGQTRPTDAEIITAASAPAPQSILPQDLMGQFTVDDAAKIRAAVQANASFWLLWSAMQAQKDPMHAGNERFLQGWNALVSVLGADRMAAIAASLGVKV
jgi:hypothetical protein